jgi:hypothetical protein
VQGALEASRLIRKAEQNRRLSGQANQALHLGRATAFDHWGCLRFEQPSGITGRRLHDATFYAEKIIVPGGATAPPAWHRFVVDVAPL